MDEGEPQVVTTERAFAGTARSAPAGARVPVEVRVAVEDPFTAYRRARNGVSSARSRLPSTVDGAYLETTGGQSGWGHFAVGPVSRLRVAPALEPIGGTDPSPTLAELAGLLDSETLVREREDLPDSLAETAYTDDERGVVIGVRHRTRPHEGVQFPPESILTAVGMEMVEAFVRSCRDGG